MKAIIGFLLIAAAVAWGSDRLDELCNCPVRPAAAAPPARTGPTVVETSPYTTGATRWAVP